MHLYAIMYLYAIMNLYATMHPEGTAKFKSLDSDNGLTTISTPHRTKTIEVISSLESIAIVVPTFDQVIVLGFRKANISPLKMAADLTQIINFKHKDL